MAQLKTGSQMIAAGAVRAGCRFFAGYPITPASGIYRSMIESLPQRGDVAINAPDEISALAYCVGASLRGYKAMTATSGPGWALMIETVQYALMTETPVVIVLVQRLGPSTGGATQGAQGDVLLAEFCTSGGYTIPVLSPSSAAECYTLTIEAFNRAESLRSPVVLLADKEVVMTSEVVMPEDLVAPEIIERKRAANGQGAYEFSLVSDVPDFAEVGGSLKVTATGSAHNKRGLLRKNDEETLLVLHHLEEKIRARTDELSLVSRYGPPDAESVVISYGISARAAMAAAAIARRQGISLSVLNVQSLFPVPARTLTDETAQARRVIIAEENLTGQYRSVISSCFSGKEIIGVNKIGSMITPGEILDALSGR